MSADSPLRVVVAGSGVAALEALLGLRRWAEERVELEVVAPGLTLDYRPLRVREPFGADGARPIDVAEVIADIGAIHRHGALTAVNSADKTASTSRGEKLRYDALVVATGAVRVPAVPGALTFSERRDVSPLERLLDDIAHGGARSVAFVVPPGAGWPLPAYELALLTAAETRKHRTAEVKLTLVTPEWQPLALFGEAVSGSVAELLDEQGIAFVPSTHPVRFAAGELELVPRRVVAVDRVVALPRLEGRRLGGIPCDGDGFIPTDLHGAVPGAPGVYAAGDITTFPIKQGGIAAQQADAVAEAIAAMAGAPLDPRPFHPILRALLLTGGEPRFLRAELVGGQGEASVASAEALWTPPAKIAARELGHYLARIVPDE